MDLDRRLEDLYTTLGEFKPTDSASWQLAQIFNALLAEVKKNHAGDPVVGAIQPAEQASIPTVSTSDCGTLRAATLQLMDAMGGS